MLTGIVPRHTMLTLERRFPVVSAVVDWDTGRSSSTESSEDTVIEKDPSPVARRSFLSRLGLGMTTLGATLGSSAASAQAPAPAPRWQPGRHAQDDWLDQLPGQHRFVFDTTQFEGFGGALLTPTTSFWRTRTATASGTPTSPSSSSCVTTRRCLPSTTRCGRSTASRWRSEAASRIPRPGQAPKVNIFNAAALVAQLPSLGTTLDSLLKRGVHLAVCRWRPVAWPAPSRRRPRAPRMPSTTN